MLHHMIAGDSVLHLGCGSPAGQTRQALSSAVSVQYVGHSPGLLEMNKKMFITTTRENVLRKRQVGAIG